MNPSLLLYCDITSLQRLFSHVYHVWSENVKISFLQTSAIKASELEHIISICVLSYFEICRRVCFLCFVIKNQLAPGIVFIYLKDILFMCCGPKKQHNPQLSEHAEVQSFSFNTDISSRWTKKQEHLHRVMQIQREPT